jgi:hypothetical protein
MKRRRKAQKAHKLNRKIITSVAAIIILCVAIAAYIHFSTPTDAMTGPTTVSVVPASTTLQNALIGQTVEVYINVTNVRDLWGWELDYLSFNPKVLNLTGVREGPFLKTAGPTFFVTTLNATNWLQDGILPSTNEAMSVNVTAHGSGVVLVLTFAVLGPGISPISIDGENSTSYMPAFILYTNHEIEYVNNETTGEMRTINCTVTNGQITVANIA